MEGTACICCLSTKNCKKLSDDARNIYFKVTEVRKFATLSEKARQPLSFQIAEPGYQLAACGKCKEFLQEVETFRKKCIQSKDTFEKKIVKVETLDELDINDCLETKVSDDDNSPHFEELTVLDGIKVELPEQGVPNYCKHCKLELKHLTALEFAEHISGEEEFKRRIRVESYQKCNMCGFSDSDFHIVKDHIEEEQ